MTPPEPPALHLVTDDRLPRPALLAAIQRAVGQGVDWVQVRDPGASARDLLSLAREVLAICRPHGVRVAVNDRLDVALAAGADGIQLGGRSLPVAVARSLAGALLIGASVHDRAAAIQAIADGADWVTFGHIFATASHPGEAPRGIDALARLVRAVHRPVIAIGGIGVEQVGPVMAAGAAGIAVISAITGAPDPAQATAALRRALDAARPASA
jgi:thiamine-phosphate pyrophosphorylase